MRSTAWLLFLLAATLTTALGCSDDSTAPAPPSTSTGLLEGQIGDADFQITLGATAGDRNHRRCEGPFVLRGFNLHYVDSLSALVVDLTVTNNSQFPYNEPVGLTFVKLLPEGVTVLNPDNGINGEGAAIVFAFANDDAKWTPGETSLPRTVEFGVEKGKAVAFVARLDIGPPIDGGTIAGLVWNDADKDGEIDSLEVGVPGQRIVLRSISDDEDTTVTDTRRATRTDRHGLYAFNRLPAGVYLVTKLPNDFTTPTTATEITVLLTESDGDVSDFTDANFGCVVERPNPFPLGAFAEVNGTYLTDPDRVAAQGIDLERCGPHVLGGDDGSDDEVDCSKGKLRGPVTAVDDEGGAFAVMGTSVSFDQATFAIDVEVGQRLDVRVHRADDGSLVVDDIKEWHSEKEQVHGRIQHVELGDGGVIRLTVLNTLVIVARDPSVMP